MCCFACSPDCTEELDAALVLRIIEEAAQLPEIKKIGFTGGEATLRKDLLLKCIKRTKMHGMKATLTSNGSWAHSPDAARKWLLDFKNTGLDLLTISVDEYHQQYIPLDHIRNIIRANKDIGLMIMLAIGDSLEKRDAFALINELREDLYEVPVTVYPFIAVGRGETLTHTVQKAVDPQWRCHNQRILSILYDGSVYPCCSQAVYESLLCEGNIKNTTLKEIIEKYQYFSVFSEFSCHDFKWLLQKAKEYQIEVSKTTQSPCSFCHELFSNPMFVDKLREEIIRKRSITLFEKLEEMSEENKSLKSQSAIVNGYRITAMVAVSGLGSVKISPSTSSSPSVLYNFNCKQGYSERTACKEVSDYFRNNVRFFNNFPNNMPLTFRADGISYQKKRIFP